MVPDDSSSGPLDTWDHLLKRIAVPEPSAFAGTPRFELIRRLGAGGCGIVYLVRDHAIGAEVALKTLPSLHPELIFRLKHEFRALSGVRHENLVSFYEMFAEGDQLFFTMEYVPGSHFLEHVRGKDGLNEERLRKCLAQLARGLSFLHGAGKLHRDIKPSNVLVASDGERVVLLDFGLATEIEEGHLGRSSVIAGTPEYMSPEQRTGRPLTPASDWYCVGTMLYQALTGVLPSQGRHAEVAAERAWSEPPPVEHIAKGAPQDLARLCRSLLCADPARRAGMAEVTSVLGAIDHASPVTVRRDADAPLVGRDAELTCLRTAWNSVDDRSGVTVLLDGTSGVGKTALVQSFLRDTERDGAVVLRGRCYERERVPYQGIDSLIDDVCLFLSAQGAQGAEAFLPHHVSALVRLFPVLERVGVVASHRARLGTEGLNQQDLRRQAFGAFRDLLARISDRFPLILHIDDLQWGDVDTAALLLEALRPPDAPGMLLVLSFRSEDRKSSPCLERLLGGPLGHVVELAVEPLRADAAGVLLRRHLRADQASMDVSTAAGDAAGTPFFLIELGRYLARREVAAGREQAVDLEVVLRERIDHLSDDARALLEAVAVSGHPIPATVARRACPLVGSPWDAWSDLVDGRLVRLAGESQARLVEPLHDRIREVVNRGLPLQRVVDVHRRLAAAFEEAGDADPEVLARHHAAAGERERAQVCAASAAFQAEQALAFDRAARMFRWALELTPTDHRDRQELQVGLARSLANAGRGVDAARAYLEAAEHADRSARNGLERDAALQLLISGRIDEGRDLATTALMEVGLAIPGTPRRALVSLVARMIFFSVRGSRFVRHSESEVSADRLARMAHLFALSQGLSMVDVVRGGEAGIRYLLLALSAGEPVRVALGLALLAGHWGVLAPWSRRTAALMARMDRVVAEAGDAGAKALAMTAKAAHAQSCGPWPDAFEKADLAQRFLAETCIGMNWELWTTRTFGVWALFYLGRWRELSRRVDVYLTEARDRGNVYAMTSMRVPFGLMRWLAVGDVAGAREQARESVAAWSVRGFHLQHYWFLLGESLIDLYEGRGTSAWRRMGAGWTGLSRSMLLQLPIVRTQMLHVRGCCAIAAAAEQSDEAVRRSMLREATHASSRLRKIGSNMARSLAELLVASVECNERQGDAAGRRFATAIVGCELEGMEAYAAAARFQRARLQGGDAPGVFLADADVEDPGAVARMLVPLATRARSRST